MNVFLGAAFLAIALSPAPVRHYRFDEGTGNEVANHATVEPGKRAVTGGPLGSLEICCSTPYGMDSVESYKTRRTDAIESVWCKGRLPGKSALRVGTHDVGLYRSGITGNELANGFTVAGWIKFESDPFRPDAFSVPLRLGTGVCDNGFVFSWSKSQSNEKGTVSFRVGRSAGTGEPRSVAIDMANCESGVWHAFACSMDGEEMRLWLDGRHAATNAGTKLVSAYKPGTWSGTKPFTGTTRVSCLHIGNRMNERVHTPFALDELAVFDRALSPGEISSFLMARPAAGTLDEQREASLEERKEREFAQKIAMSIPEDSNGYFRRGTPVPVKVRGAPEGSTLEVFLETTRGNERFRKTLPVDGKGNLDWSFAEKTCDAYNLFLSLKDASGKTLKKTDLPYVIGIVPEAPARLDSPFGFWAMEEDFSYDSNLRRTDIPFWNGTVITNGYLAKRNRYLERQKIPASDLREYGLFPFDCGLNLRPGRKLSEDEKNRIRKTYRATAGVAAEYGMDEFEVSSEVDGRTTPETYVQLLDIVKETLDATHGRGKYKLYPPGATPCAIPFINKILELGAADYVDGVSHHNYLANPVYNFHWDNPGARLGEVAAKHSARTGRKIEMYNTESGVFSLPYVKNRPMTREHARTAGYGISDIGGYESYTTSMPTLPDDEAAAIQVHAVFANLASGYKMYVKCQSPMLDGALPCRQGVALTALSGQVLNGMDAIKTVKLSSLKSLAVLIDRTDPETGKKSNCFSVFGMEKRLFTFRAAPNAIYKTMDLLGNCGEIRADGNGILKIESSLEPVYVFGVPEGIAELSPMKIVLPSELGDDGIAKGTIILENPFGTPVKGELAAGKLRGAEIEIAEKPASLNPGETRKIPFVLRARALKRRNYPMRATFGPFAAETVFASNGPICTIPRVEGKFELDGNEEKWEGIPETVCDTDEDVVHGKPNFAEQWLPQWANAKDLSVRMRTCYIRDEAIFFRIDVCDQTLHPAPPSEKGLEFRYDCIELFADTRRGKALGSPVDYGADQIIIPAVASDTMKESPLWSVKKGKSHVAVEASGMRTPKGWMVEGKIVPLKESSLRLRPGSRLMMDFIIDDCDSPDRLRKSAMAVHGSFNNNSNVAGWGRYELGL